MAPEPEIRRKAVPWAAPGWRGVGRVQKPHGRGVSTSQPRFRCPHFEGAVLLGFCTFGSAESAKPELAWDPRHRRATPPCTGNSGLSPSSLGHSLPILFLTGMVALCAMILPGISGAYLTLLLNQYEYLLNAVKTLSLPDIIAYMAGGVVGLLLFSKALKYLLRHHHGIMLGFLTGLMLGSTRLLADTIGAAGGFDMQAWLFTAVGIGVIVLMEWARRRFAAGR